MSQKYSSRDFPGMCDVSGDVAPRPLRRVEKDTAAMVSHHW